MLKAKEMNLINLRKRVIDTEDIKKSLEDKLLMITILEQTIKELKIKHKKEKDDVRNQHEIETSNFKKENHHMHQILSVNLANDEKMNFLQKELDSPKLNNIKKMQALESRIHNYDSVYLVDGSDDESSLHQHQVIKSEETRGNKTSTGRPKTARNEFKYGSDKISLKDKR